MDNRTFANRLARQMGCDPATVSNLTAALSDVMSQCLVEFDTVAIPGFGNFMPQKEQEKIVIDPATGKRMLIPPVVKAEFVAGSMLKKRL